MSERLRAKDKLNYQYLVVIEFHCVFVSCKIEEKQEQIYSYRNSDVT